MPYVDNQGLRIHYQVEGKGPPLVLQHGSTASIQAWYESGYVGPLRVHYRLILVDGRGHGASDKPHDVAAYALALRVSDIVAVLDDLGIRKAHYWGYSMGGWMGFGMAQQAAHRLRSLVIGGAHPYAERAAAFHGVDGTDPEAFVAALERFMGARVTLELRERIVGNDLLALAAAMHDRDALVEVLPSMTMPSCLYVGEADPRYPKVEACAELMPNATMVSLPGLDHVGAFMRADRVLPPIMKFLQGVCESGQAPD